MHTDHPSILAKVATSYWHAVSGLLFLASIIAVIGAWRIYLIWHCGKTPTKEISPADAPSICHAAGHNDVGAQGSKMFNFVFVVVASRAMTKGGQRHMHHQLSEYQFSVVHRRLRPATGNTPVCRYRNSNQDQEKIAASYVRSVPHSESIMQALGQQ